MMEQMTNSTNVQKQLQMSDYRIRRLIFSGQLTAYKIGARWRFKPSDVARCQKVTVCQ